MPEGYTLQSYFEKVVREGLEERLAELRRRQGAGLARHGEEVYRQRLEYEIQVIEKMGFPGYFLVVWDFIRHARENDVPVGPGRGSAAGSLVAYSLRITNIDPLQYDLLFERFLNPDRISMPDIDIDFCMRGRGKVINYVGEKYGRDRVAQIITFGTLAAKAVIRDVGRVMGLPYAKVDRVAKLIPDMTRSLKDAVKDNDALAAEMKDPEVKQVIEVGQRLEGLTRHASVHAAGVVITPSRLDELVPLYKVTKGDEEQVMTQWDMNVIESLGLLKMDFLGLRTLTVLDDAVKIVRQQGISLDLDDVPLDDPETFKVFSEGRTSGIFQFESRGMTDLLRRVKPSRFDELAALNALYRPGAMTLIDEYIQRKQGKRFAFLAPEMQPILEETYGIIVYQEQVMLTAVEVAGFSMAEADTLRKAMGKKKKDVMAKMKAQFVDGAAGRGMPREKASDLWDKIEPFAGYGFNKSHSVAYANLAYKTAYLKAHYPVAFMAAMLNSELSSSDAIAKYIGESKNMGIGLLPVDTNESSYFFAVVDNQIRFGLGAVKGVGETAIESVLKARLRVGRFRSLAHMVREVDPRVVNRKVLECLGKAGAFDGLHPNRAAVLANIDLALDYAQKWREAQEGFQNNLFGGIGVVSADEPVFDDSTRDWSLKERLRNEKEALGLYLHGNPLSEHQAEIERLITHTTADLKEGVEGSATLGGVVNGFNRVKIKTGVNAGRFMGRFVLEDLTGSIPVTLFANQLQQFGHLIADDTVVLVKGQVRERGGEMEMTVEEVSPLKDLGVRPLAGIDVLLKASAISTKSMLRLRDLLVEHPGDVPVTLQVQLSDRVIHIAAQENYKVEHSPELASSIERMFGQGTVRERYQAAPA